MLLVHTKQGRPPFSCWSAPAIACAQWHFVTGLPPSQGKTVILTIVDRFSKAVCILWLSLSSPQLKKQPGSWRTSCSAHMGSPLTSSRDRVDGLSLRYGRLFARLEEPQSVSHRGSIQRSVGAGQSGVHSFPGLNTPIIP